MKLLSLFQRLDELRIRYKSAGEHDQYDVIAHRGNVWLVGDNDRDTEKVAQDIGIQSGAYEDGDSVEDITSRLEERPDIISARYDPDNQALWVPDNELGHHPRASLELKKLAELLGVDSVSGNRYFAQDDAEARFYRHEMEGQVPDELYHGIDANALPDILRLGLVPGRGDGNWEVGQFDLVFLAADWHKAAFHASRQQHEGHGAPVILKVKIPDRTKIEPDFDAVNAFGTDDYEKVDELGYSGSNAYMPSHGESGRQEIANQNPDAKNLPLVSGVIGYSGRIPPSHIKQIDVDLRGEMGDHNEPEFTSFDIPAELAELRDALDLYGDYEYWYPGMRDELDDREEEDDDMYEDDSDHAEALQQTGFWGQAGAGVLFQARDTGRILFAHRSDDVEEPNTWGTWGGAIDRGENPKVAAAREAHEETGHAADPRNIIPMYIFKHPSGFQYFNFLVIVESEFQPRLNWESQGAEWFDFGEWPQPLHPGTALLLNDQKNLSIMRMNAQ